MLERAHLLKGQMKETNYKVYREYELTKEGAELVKKLSKETQNAKCAPSNELKQSFVEKMFMMLL